MTKIILCADLHLGIKNKLDNTINACKVISKFATDHGIDTIIILGDMFHDRRTLDIETLVKTCEFFEEVSNQKWITFPGNHDMYLRYSWKITSLKPLKKYLTVINDVSLLKINDHRFWVVPFIQMEEAYIKVIDMLDIQPEDRLLTHIGLKGAVFNTCFLFKSWNSVNMNRWPFRRVYTGHFHVRQQVGKAYYPGSLIPFKFDEGNCAHGFYVYDIENNDHNFVDIWKIWDRYSSEKQPPGYVTVAVRELDKATVDNHNVRVVYHTDLTDSEKRDIKKMLSDKGAITVRWLDKTEKSKVVNMERVVEYGNLFRSWIQADEKRVKDLNKDLLILLNDEITGIGDDLYLAENE